MLIRCDLKRVQKGNALHSRLNKIYGTMVLLWLILLKPRTVNLTTLV